MIDRYNYEEFFLLYVDGELSQADRNAVDDFVQQNPDLATELEMLKHSVLPVDNMVFLDKASLLKKEAAINSSNYETFLLLSVDDELNAQQRQELETYILQNPAVQEAYSVLLQTRLSPEVIAHPNKKELYRYEKVKQIELGGWMRISAAAALLLLAVSTWLMWPDQQATGVVAVINKPANMTEEIAEKAEAVNQTKESSIAKTAIEEPGKHLIRESIAAVSANKVVKQTRTAGNKDNVAPTPLSQKLLPPTEEMLPALIKKDIAAAHPHTMLVEENKANMMVEAGSDENITEVQHAVYKPIEEEEENNIIYFGAAELNKNKLKNIFKKAAVLFERKEKNGEEKIVRIASFNFKSK